MTDMTATALTALSQSISAVVERAAGHVVSVHSHRARASGFVWRPGLIVTADEALAEDGDVLVQPQPLPQRASAATIPPTLRYCGSIARICRCCRSPPPIRHSARCRWSSAPSKAALPQASAWCRGRGVHGEACAAATSMPGSSSTLPCAAAARVRSRLTRQAMPSAWRCAVRARPS
jgi:hypothetical protein